MASPRLEKVVLRDRLPSAVQDRGTSPTYTSFKKSKILPLDLRSIRDWSLTDLLLISDIDGNLHGVERNTGALLWTLPMDEPLVKLSSVKVNKTDSPQPPNILWFVEPYEEGTLYYFTPKFGLNRLPTSIKNLVLESPFLLLGDDKIYTGTRTTSLYTINVRTGVIESSFGSNEKCPVPNSHKEASNDSNDTIMVGKTTYYLSIHSQENKNVVWNVTYSQWGPNNIDNDLIVQNEQSFDKLYFTPFHDKSLLAINKDLGTPVWINKLPSLAVNVFDVFNNKKNDYVILPHPLKVLNELQVSNDAGHSTSENSDLCFINKTANGKEWFAMSFNNYPTLIKSAPISKYQMILYKMQSHDMPADLNFNFLKKFLIDDHAQVEDLVSGIHKTYHLSAETLYQPLTRFDLENSTKDDIKQIGDGSNSIDEQPSESSSVIEKHNIPNLMNGILFPNTKEIKDILTLVSSYVSLSSSSADEKDLSLWDNADKQISRIYDHSDSHPTSKTVDSLSLVKRICEDIIVILVLLGLLMSFGRLGKLTRKFQQFFNLEPSDAIAKSTDSEKLPTTLRTKLDPEKLQSFDVEETELKSDLSGKDDFESSEKTRQFDSRQSLQDLSDPATKPIKKVTIISPNALLEDADGSSYSSNEEEQNDEKPQSLAGLQKSADEEADTGEFATKKKRKRGSRGGKRGGSKGKKSPEDAPEETDDVAPNSEETIATKSLIKAIAEIPSSKLTTKRLQIENNLVISDKVLGYGSHGTVVYQGTFENRPVAVKRMLLDFFDIANHEVRLLQESDDHPNVIRYFCSQSSEMEKFLYIALELCLCSLEDITEKAKSYPKDLRLTETNKSASLLQLASGLHYLHSLKIVHRDLKPQNILVADTKSSAKSSANGESNTDANVRLLISDFGLCKKLDNDQSSFRATTQHAASGTSGWRAPELLLHHDLLEISPDTISSIGSSSVHSVGAGNGSASTSSGGKRLTKAIDIFSLGCVFYYILANGNHAFGDRYLREGNIIKGEYDLSLLAAFCPNDYVEASHLISTMIHFNPKMRPDTGTIMKHPYFWSTNKKLHFLLKVSDRFEVERRDPPSELLLKLEAVGNEIHKGDWHAQFNDEFMDNLGKYRKYQREKLMDLLRALRNKYHHFNDMPESLKQKLSPLPHGFYKYFNDKFPHLLMSIYFVVEQNLKQEHAFEEFY